MAAVGTARVTRASLVVFVALVWGCAPLTSPPDLPKIGGVYHVVRTGENLFRIGKAYDVAYEELARVNRIKDPSLIHVGQRIFIPGATRQLPVDVIAPTEPVLGAPQTPGDAPILEPASQSFLWPVSGTINSGYGRRGPSFHDGIDIGAPEGTSIRAIEQGEVIYSGQLRGYGNIVIIKHAGGFTSVYAHNQINFVREGQSVLRGEIIARVGSSGRVSAPHLHFEIRKNNIAEDPLRYFRRVCCLSVSDNVSR